MAKSSQQEARVLIIGTLIILFVVVFSLIFPIIQKKKISSLGEEVTEDLQEDSTEFLSQEELFTLIDTDRPYLLDIRSDSDYYRSHIVGSVQKDISEIPEVVHALQAPESPSVIVIIGYKSQSMQEAQISAYLTEHLPGKTIFTLSEGFETWENSSRPTIHAGDPTDPIDQSKISYITPSEARKKMTSNNTLTILDVRSTTAYTKDHIDPSINVPLDEIETGTGKIPRSRPILVFGADALESFQAGVRLFDLSYLNVETLDGGYEDLFETPSEQ